MMNYDLTPFWRSTVGFDRLFNLLEDDAFRTAGEQNYPPYNIERTGEDSYEVTLAVAGFTPEEIAITAEQNVLMVEGRKSEKTERHYLYHAFPAGRSAGSSTSPITSRSKARLSRASCCRSGW